MGIPQIRNSLFFRNLEVAEHDNVSKFWLLSCWFLPFKEDSCGQFCPFVSGFEQWSRRIRTFITKSRNRKVLRILTFFQVFQTLQAEENVLDFHHVGQSIMSIYAAVFLSPKCLGGNSVVPVLKTSKKSQEVSTSEAFGWKSQHLPMQRHSRVGPQPAQLCPGENGREVLLLPR